MIANFDLLGDPIPENWGKRGRPAHIPTDRNRNKIRLLLALGRTNARIARGLRITGKTLAKHFFRELRQRDEARPALEAAHAMMIFRSAKGGNVGGIKELVKLMEKSDLPLPQPPRAQPAKPEKLGKNAAQEVGEDSVWGRLLN